MLVEQPGELIYLVPILTSKDDVKEDIKRISYVQKRFITYLLIRCTFSFAFQKGINRIFKAINLQAVLSKDCVRRLGLSRVGMKITFPCLGAECLQNYLLQNDMIIMENGGVNKITNYKNYIHWGYVVRNHEG